jgi:hypothetical protein
MVFKFTTHSLDAIIEYTGHKDKACSHYYTN